MCSSFRYAEMSMLQLSQITECTGAAHETNAVMRVKIEAVDRAQRLFERGTDLFFLWRWQTVAKLAKLREKDKYWPARFGYGVLKRRMRAQVARTLLRRVGFFTSNSRGNEILASRMFELIVMSCVV